MKYIKIFAVVVCLLAVLSACSINLSLDGTYTTNETLVNSSVTFNGDKITMSALGLNFSGTYKLEGDEIIITKNILGVESEQTMSFELKGNSVVIDGTEYVRQN